MRAHQLNEDGLIVNTIEVESLDVVPNLIDADLIGGSIGDSVIGGILYPASPAIVPQDRHITKLAFDNRFLMTELVGMEMASIDNPSASAEIRLQSAALRVYQKKVDRATFIDLDRADTRAGVIAMETATLLSAGRALQILDAPIQDTERPLP